MVVCHYYSWLKKHATMKDAAIMKEVLQVMAKYQEMSVT